MRAGECVYGEHATYEDSRFSSHRILSSWLWPCISLFHNIIRGISYILSFGLYEKCITVITETYFPLSRNSLSPSLFLSLSLSTFFYGFAWNWMLWAVNKCNRVIIPDNLFRFLFIRTHVKKLNSTEMDVWARKNWRESQRDRVKTRDGEKMDGGWHYNKDDGVCIYVSKKIAWIPFGSLQFHAFSLALPLPLAHHSSIRRRHLHCHRTQNTQRVERICAFNLCVNVCVCVQSIVMCRSRHTLSNELGVTEATKDSRPE